MYLCKFNVLSVTVIPHSPPSDSVRDSSGESDVHHGDGEICSICHMQLADPPLGHDDLSDDLPLAVEGGWYGCCKLVDIVSINVLPEQAKYSGTVTLPCGHTFHRSCITKWWQVRPTCPLCNVEGTGHIETKQTCVFSCVKYDMNSTLRTTLHYKQQKIYVSIKYM